MNEFKPILDFLLYTKWVSWILHFTGFLLFFRFSGTKLAWAIFLVFGIEVWEMCDWSIKDPLRWWRMPDTWLDILAGLFGILLAYLWLKKKAARP